MTSTTNRARLVSGNQSSTDGRQQITGLTINGHEASHRWTLSELVDSFNAQPARRMTAYPENPTIS